MKRKRNYKWLKLKSYKEGEARTGINSVSLWNFLALKGLIN